MSHKLGFYLHSSQDQHGLWSLFERIKPAVILIHMDTKNDDLLRQLREWRSPEAFVVGRFYIDRSEQDDLLSADDPVAAGRSLAERLFKKDEFFVTKRAGPANRLLVDAWMSLNEPFPGPSWDDWPLQTEAERRRIRNWAHNYDLLQVAFRQRLQELIPGVDAVAFNFGSGNFQSGRQYVEWFPETLAAYTYLGFHEYGWPVMAPHLLADKTQPVKTHVGLCQRIMQEIQANPAYGTRHQAIITEAGLARAHLHQNDKAGDVGWLNAVEPQSQQAYWRSLQWYNGLLDQHAFIKGACLFEVGWQEDWKSFRLTGTYKGPDGQEHPIEIMNWVADPASAPQ